jgi:hypothetical protein
LVSWSRWSSIPLPQVSIVTEEGGGGRRYVWMKKDERIGKNKERTNIMHHPRILITIRPRKTHTLWQLHRPLPHHLNLHTIGIKLRPSLRISFIAYIPLVQADHLSADQIMPCPQPLRDPNIHMSKVLRDIAGRAPFPCCREGRGGVLALVPDFHEGGFCRWVGGDVY